jgi:3-hydroxyisobutyrate dehydrogenase
MAVCEALALSAKAGVSRKTMLEAISGGAASSWQLLNLGPKMVDGDFKPGFKVWHQQKDLRHALDLAREIDLPLPGTALVAQLYATVAADGHKEAGTQALVKALEKLGDVSVGE